MEAALGALPLGHAQGVVLRVGLVLAYTVSAAVVMRAFGMPVPPERMLVTNAIVTVVGALPISVSGLGTTQVLMRIFFAPFVTDDAIGPRHRRVLHGHDRGVHRSSAR